MIEAEEIISNWTSFLKILTKWSKVNPRWKTLLEFYTKHEDRFCYMPASSKLTYHNSFPGGYLAHVLNVLDFSFDVMKLWAKHIEIDFTDEELAFVAINHDLGKFGSEDYENYIEQTDQWRINKMGEVYKNNPELGFMKVQDRSLFLLQSIGVPMNEKEYLAIKLHDGLYEESNKSYYISFSEDYKLRSNLPYIIHQADLMAARIEGHMIKKDLSAVTVKEPVKQFKTIEKPTSPPTKFLKEGENPVKKTSIRTIDKFFNK